MGHYDSSYAKDAFDQMSTGEKALFNAKFDLDLVLNPHEIWATFDDVSGWCLREYAEKNNLETEMMGNLIVAHKKEPRIWE